MDLQQLRCFIAVAEDLHFGRAAQRIGLLPAALGRHIRLLEAHLGTQILTRTTRHVALTDDGELLLAEARKIIALSDSVAQRLQARRRKRVATLRIGAIDSAAAGLIPLLLQDFRTNAVHVAVQLLEDKTIRLLPRLLSGRLDLAFVRPPPSADKRLTILFLFHETAVVAVPTRHRLAKRSSLSIADLAMQPMIVPERRARPHSHDLTVKLFAEAGLQPTVSQMADEKQTIVNLVAAGIGMAIVPRWTARMAVAGVRYVPLIVQGSAHSTGILTPGTMNRLPLAAAWITGARDPVRDAFLATLRARLAVYAAQA
jgi:DNA-binding transcriptional LysR family regulator